MMMVLQICDIINMSTFMVDTKCPMSYVLNVAAFMITFHDLGTGITAPFVKYLVLLHNGVTHSPSAN